MLGRLMTILIGLVIMVACSPQVSSPSPPAISREPLLVAAASDLKFAFTEIAELYTKQTGQRVTPTFGSTGQFAQQIESGAPFDLFAAADTSHLERLKAQGLIIPETQQLYARGRIVLAVNKQSGAQATTLKDLTAPTLKQIAIANPAHAPYGVAAMQALQAEGIWEQVKPKLVYGENIAQTLQYVQTGNAPVGIVALSVANVPEVSWTLIDDKLHQPLDQALAVLKSSRRVEAARAFIAFINGSQGRPIMKKYGFILPGEL